MSTKSDLTIKILIALFGLAGALWLSFLMPQWEAPWVDPPRDQREHIPSLLFKIMSFGFSMPANDLVWLSALNDSTLTHTHGLYRPKIFYDLDLITDMDPYFYEPYSIGASLLATVRDDGVGAAILLKKALSFINGQLDHLPTTFKQKYWKNADFIPVLLGYVELFELQNYPGAIEAFRQIRHHDNIPWEYKGLVRAVLDPRQVELMAKRVLEILYQSQSTDEGRRQIQEQWDGLLIAIQVNQIQKKYETWKRQAKRKDWKYFVMQYPQYRFDSHHGVISLRSDGVLQTTTSRKKILGMYLYESTSSN